MINEESEKSFQTGKNAFRQGRLEDCILWFRSAVRSDPESASTNGRIGGIRSYICGFLSDQFMTFRDSLSEERQKIGIRDYTTPGDSERLAYREKIYSLSKEMYRAVECKYAMIEFWRDAGVSNDTLVGELTDLVSFFDGIYTITGLCRQDLLGALRSHVEYDSSKRFQSWLDKVRND